MRTMQRLIFADKVLVMPTILFAAYVGIFPVYNSETGDPSTAADVPGIIFGFVDWLIFHVWIWLRILDLFGHHRIRLTNDSHNLLTSVVATEHVVAVHPVHARTEFPAPNRDDRPLQPIRPNQFDRRY